MKKIAVFISGSGSNLQALIDAVKKNEINGKIEVVISNRKDAYGLERARKHNITTMYIPKKDLTIQKHSEQILDYLKDKNIDLIVLAGYLSILSDEFTSKYKNKIVNIHPSLIPSFCGMGYHGNKVHEAVYKSGVKYTGATVHFVDENVDTGYIINQEVVKIDIMDTVEDISKKVLEIEHKLLTKTVKALCDNKVIIKNERAFILED